MTTNQTIDGVPRELLRWLDDFINDGLELSKEEASISARLRALLDAPKCKTCGDQGEIFVSKGKVESHMLTDYEIGLGHGACEMWDKIKALNPSL